MNMLNPIIKLYIVQGFMIDCINYRVWWTALIIGYCVCEGGGGEDK